MAIWSLTQERVDRLLQQIGDKEREIDTLLKLSPKDLWSRDLDEFIGEWRFQLDDDIKRQKKNASLGRRASNKLKFGGKVGAKKGTKAKDGDTEDSDYAVVKPKRTGSGPTRVQQKPVSDFFEALKAHPPIPNRAAEVVKPAAALAANPAMGVASFDGSSDPLEDTKHDDVEMSDAEQKFEKSTAAASKSKGVVAAKVDKLASKVVNTATVPARKACLAASKPRKYHVDSDTGSDSDDNGNGMLGDVSKMVKGIGGVADSNLGANPLFSATTTTTIISTSKPNVAPEAAKPSFDFSEDETDFSGLAPQLITAQPKAGTEGNAAKGNSNSNLLGDDDTSSEIELPVPTTTSANIAPAAASPFPKAVRVRAKPGPKPGRKPAAKPAKTTAATAKPAKAITATTAAAAAKGGKRAVKGKAVPVSAAAARPDAQKISIESDLDDNDNDDVDNGGALNGLNSEETSSDVDISDVPATAPVPTRRAVAPALTSTSTGRPVRRAAATAAAAASKKASKYIDIDSDSEEDLVADDDDDDDEDEFDEDDDSE